MEYGMCAGIIQPVRSSDLIRARFPLRCWQKEIAAGQHFQFRAGLRSAYCSNAVAKYALWRDA